MKNRLFDVQDAHGVWRTLRPVALAPREDMAARIEQIEAHIADLPEYQPFKSAFESDFYLRHLCLEALRLGGVEESWLRSPRGTWDIDLISALLLPRCENLAVLPGLLVAINWPPQSGDGASEGEAQTYEEIVASLWSFCQSFTEALEIAKSHPANEAIAICQARAKQDEAAAIAANPELAKKKYQRQWQKKARGEIDQLTQLNGTQGLTPI